MAQKKRNRSKNHSLEKNRSCYGYPEPDQSPDRKYPGIDRVGRKGRKPRPSLKRVLFFWAFVNMGLIMNIVEILFYGVVVLYILKNWKRE